MTKPIQNKIYLSPPVVTEQEAFAVSEALAQGWVAPVGPQLLTFEQKIEALISDKRVLALNSGSAALQLALRLAGVGQGDLVACNTFTFGAAANAIIHNGAQPVFIETNTTDWCLSIKALEIAVERLGRDNKRLKALICVHNYGMPCQMDELLQFTQHHGILLIEDAAESLGSTYKGRLTGGFGLYGAYSFNGNKIITTGGGGALVVPDTENYKKALHLSTQAKVSGQVYEHDAIGYNFRMSNILASIGEVQMNKLNTIVEKKRSIFEMYKNRVDHAGYQTEDHLSFSNRWLSTLLLQNRNALEKTLVSMHENNIEVRRLWKPLHLQEPYKDYYAFTDGTSEQLYQKGICLPSGYNLTHEEQERIVSLIC